MPRSDATPEREVAALASVYALVLKRFRERQPANERVLAPEDRGPQEICKREKEVEVI